MILDKKRSLDRALKYSYQSAFVRKYIRNYIETMDNEKNPIVRALIMNPEIILFDEPTSALDPEMVGEVLELIKDIADTGMTMIIVSHEMNFVKKCANKVVFMDEGKISFSGTTSEVFNNKDNERLRDFLSKTNK